MSNKVKLSIVILSYNTKDLLRDCLNSLVRVEDELPFEVIVVDNASIDGSVELIEKEFSKVKLLKNGKNLGFARGNNKAQGVVKSKYVLFLNSDTIVKRNTLKETVNYLERNEKIGAVTCKIILPTGELDKDARRSFPTPWVSLTHLVFKLDKVFPKSKLFSLYWYGYKSEDETHEVDVIQGAFFMTRKKGRKTTVLVAWRCAGCWLILLVFATRSSTPMEISSSAWRRTASVRSFATTRSGPRCSRPPDALWKHTGQPTRR